MGNMSHTSIQMEYSYLRRWLQGDRKSFDRYRRCPFESSKFSTPAGKSGLEDVADCGEYRHGTSQRLHYVFGSCIQDTVSHFIQMATFLGSVVSRLHCRRLLFSLTSTMSDKAAELSKYTMPSTIRTQEIGHS